VLLSKIVSKFVITEPILTNMETIEKIKTLPYPNQNENLLGSLGVSVRAFLDTAESRKRSDGTCTVRLRVIHDRKIRLYSVKGVNLTAEQWLRVSNLNKKATKDTSTARDTVLKELKRAYEVIEKMDAFTWSVFDTRFKNKGTSFENVWTAFEGHREELEKKQRFSSAEIYWGAFNSFKRFYVDYKEIKRVDKEKFESKEFWGWHKLLFKDIDPEWLHDYNEWMKERQQSVTTIGMNTRCLRHLFNLGIDSGEIPKVIYPFGSSRKNKYKPPAHRKNSRALSIPQIQALYEHSDEFVEQLKYRDIFIFSYISYGLNLADICLLAWENIDSKYIEVIRKKTEHEDETYSMRILLTDEHKRIIEQHGKGDYYVFDVLKKTDSAQTKHKLIKQFTHNLNDNLKRIAWQINKDNEIFEEKTKQISRKYKPYSNMRISSYFARHSFATIARDATIPESTISQCMGHSQGFGVTGGYFAPPDSMLEKIAKILLPFIYDKELTPLHQIVYDKLSKSEQKKFMELSSEDREKYTLAYLAKKL